MCFMRYVVLHHVQTSGEHWDFMIEQADALATWQLAANPVEGVAMPIAATRIQDHRKQYLQYEGEISDGRGSVTRVAGGTVVVCESSENLWRFELSGTINGDFRLEKIADKNWRFEADGAPA